MRDERWYLRATRYGVLRAREVAAMSNHLARLASPATTRAGGARSALAEYFDLSTTVGERIRGGRRRGGGPPKKRRRVRHSLTDDGGQARMRLKLLFDRLEPFMHRSSFTKQWVVEENAAKSRPALRRTPSNVRKRLRMARIAMNKQNQELRAVALPPTVPVPHDDSGEDRDSD